MKTLIVLMGIPGSGKTTLIKENLIPGQLWVSRDAVRFSMVSEDEEYFSKEKEVFKEFVRLINEGLETHDVVYVDATHISKASRKRLLDQITTKRDNTVLVWVKVPLKVALDQNDNRKGTRGFVPQSAIRRMYEQLQEPEIGEGFDYIVTINNVKGV